MLIPNDSLFENEKTLCECCGNITRQIGGEICEDEATEVLYFVTWTEDKPEHYPNFDLIVGKWGEEANPEDRSLISLVYLTDAEPKSFSVINASSRPQASSGLVGKAWQRDDVIGTEIAHRVFEFIDFIWLNDARLSILQ